MTDLSIVAIIPLYNGARWIEQSIRSVLAQTVQPDEFIVVDDGSTDGRQGMAIVEQLAQEHPITLLHKPNGGQSSARNFGVAHSKSALIALLDQDDAWYLDHLEMLIAPFRGADKLGWVYSDLDGIDETGAIIGREMTKTLPKQFLTLSAEHPKRTLLDCLSRDMLILPSTSLISRQAFDAIGGFDERLCGYEDDDLFRRMMRKGFGNVYLDEALTARRFHDSCSASARFLRSRHVYMRKLLEEHPEHVRDIVIPRFVSMHLAEYEKVLNANDFSAAGILCGEMEELFPHLAASDLLRSDIVRARWGLTRSAIDAQRNGGGPY